MELIETLILVVHVLAAISIIALVLMQQGRGAEMGAGFGSGSSGTVFGSGGAGNFMTRLTTTVAVIFFLTSFGLAFFAKEKSESARTVGVPEVVQDEAEREAETPALEEDTSGAGSTGESEIPGVEEVPGASEDDQ
ncbi:MAG: preprotein translocase subunit SecG [Pseudomonadales bacterium]